MSVINNYNKDLHGGYLPVRVLEQNIVAFLEEISKTYQEEIGADLKEGKLKSGIKYNLAQNPIKKKAFLDEDGNVNIWENYLQFLWSLTYSLVIVLDEGILRPRLENRFDGNIDLSNSKVSTAIDLFNSSFDLQREYRNEVFFSLPNPEVLESSQSEIIGKINSIYICAVKFILLHEIGHAHYSHHTYTPSTSDQSKDEELLVDKYAIEKLLNENDDIVRKTNTLGILIGLLSLVFFGINFSGGRTHPNWDSRLFAALNLIDIHEEDPNWLVLSLSLIFWTKKYNIPIKHKSFIVFDFFY